MKLAEGEVWVESDAGLGYKDSNLFGPIRAQTVQVPSDEMKYDWILIMSNFDNCRPKCCGPPSGGSTPEK